MNSSTSAHPNPEAHDPAVLGELEQAILRMVWQQRQATAEEQPDHETEDPIAFGLR